MTYVLHTPRFKLRTFSVADAELLFRLNSNIQNIRYTGDAPFQSIEEARQFILNYTDYENHGYGRWIIEDEDGKVFGWCGLKYHPELGFTDLGFRIFEEYWGQGIATETAQGVIQYAKDRLGLTQLIGRTATQNTASVKVLEKLGFRFSHLDDCHGIPSARIYSLDL